MAPAHPSSPHDAKTGSDEVGRGTADLAPATGPGVADAPGQAFQEPATPVGLANAALVEQDEAAEAADEEGGTRGGAKEGLEEVKPSSLFPYSPPPHPGRLRPFDGYYAPLPSFHTLSKQQHRPNLAIHTLPASPPLSPTLSTAPSRSTSPKGRGLRKLVSRKSSRDSYGEKKERKTGKKGGGVLEELAKARREKSGSCAETATPRSPVSPSSPASPTFLSAPSSPIVSEGRRGKMVLPGLDEEDEADSRAGGITPQDRHYINRMLTNLQLQREFTSLSSIGTLSTYGPPFLPHANGPNSRPLPSSASAERTKKKGSGFLGMFGGGGGGGGEVGEAKDPQFEGYVWDPAGVQDSPMCEYLFWRFIYNAPALRSAKPEYWTEGIQAFWDSFAEKDLSSTVERGEVTKRRMLSLGIVRLLGSYASNSIKPRGIAAPARPSKPQMRQIDLLVPGSMEDMIQRYTDGAGGVSVWLAIVDEKKEGDETLFRILTYPAASPDSSPSCTLASWSTVSALYRSLTSLDKDSRLSLPTLPYAASSKPASRADVQQYLRILVIALSVPPPSVEHDSPLLQQARAEVESFLLSDTSTPRLTESELYVLRTRAEAEDEADAKKHSAWVGAGGRVRRLRTVWLRYRQALINSDELDKTVHLLRKHSHINELPTPYRDAEEWARIWVAYALHYIFVEARTGPEVLNILKSFHELIPYGPVKLGLNLVNPTLAIKAVVHLVLGQPAGQQSLFQRIWSHVCKEANKHQQKLINSFRKKVGHDGISDQLKEHVEATYVQRQKTKEEAIRRDEDILLTIVRERGSAKEYAQVEAWHAEFAKNGKMATYDDKATSEGARKFADLKELLAAYYRHRDRLQVHALAVESPLVPKLLHQTIATFYDTIRDVANASKLSDRVGDLQAFLDDLVRTCETGKSSTADFISLVDRHHQSMYYFAHELVSNNPTLLDPLLDYAKSGLGFLRDGIPSSSSSSAPAERAGTDADALLATLSSAARDALLSEVRDFETWTQHAKVEKEIRLRCDLLRSASSPSTLSSSALYQSFLSQSPPDTLPRLQRAAAAQKQAQSRTGPGGDLEWAWWASSDEVGGAAAKGVVKAHQEEAAKALAGAAKKVGGAEEGGKPAAQGKKGRRASSSSHTRAHEDGFSVISMPLPAVGEESAQQERPAGEELAVPTPAGDKLRALLPQWLKSVEGALREAKEKDVK
ncbi:hypothetical protein JCM10213_000591 [Rhodosporidiobolus nylandii]